MKEAWLGLGYGLTETTFIKLEPLGAGELYMGKQKGEGELAGGAILMFRHSCECGGVEAFGCDGDDTHSGGVRACA